MNRLELWIAGWIDIACGTCQILTAGYWRPNWDFDFAAWRVFGKTRPRAKHVSFDVDPHDEADDWCDVPPFGWRCTRAKGHDGPCAAAPAPEDIAFVAKGMERLREGAP